MDDFLIAVAASIIGALVVWLIMRILQKKKDRKLHNDVIQLNNDSASVQTIITQNQNSNNPNVVTIINQLIQPAYSTQTVLSDMADTLKIHIKDTVVGKDKAIGHTDGSTEEDKTDDSDEEK